MAIASLVLAIVGAVLTSLNGTILGSAEEIVYHGWIIPVISLVLCVVGIVLGAKARKDPSQKKGIATAGMIVSIVGTVYCAIIALTAAACSGIVSSGM